MSQVARWRMIKRLAEEAIKDSTSIHFLAEAEHATRASRLASRIAADAIEECFEKEPKKAKR